MEQNEFDEPSDSDKEIVNFVVNHCDRWRDWRDVNFLDDYLEYERIFRGEWQQRIRLESLSVPESLLPLPNKP